MKKLFNFLTMLFCLITIVSCVETASENGEINVISAEEMQEILDQKDVQIVDVRSPEEYQVSHIVSAQNIDFSSPTFDEDVSKLDKKKPVILYCKGGNRSAKCAKKLKQAGFEKIYDLEGGLSKWQHSDKLSLNIKS